MSRSVYLGLLDIDISGSLDLKTKKGEASSGHIIKYLFSYALVADEVCMQGSAPLKNINVFSAYVKLLEAFRRNELHDEKPVFSFVLSDESESYLSYLVERLSFLRGIGGRNAERDAYLSNNGKFAAESLDKTLNVNRIKRRTRSVSGEYRSSLLIALASGRYDEHGVEDEVVDKVIKILSEEEIIQTNHLLNALNLSDIEQINAVYRAARERYRKANAFGCESMDSETRPHFIWKNISEYLAVLGFEPLLSDEGALSSTLLYKLRSLKSLREMNQIYFECQDQNEISALIDVLRELRLNGRIRSLMKKSPGAAIAFLFEVLNQADVGYKSVNKGLEHLAKLLVLDALDEVFAKRVYSIYSCAENLRRDLTELTSA